MRPLRTLLVGLGLLVGLMAVARAEDEVTQLDRLLRQSRERPALTLQALPPPTGERSARRRLVEAQLLIAAGQHEAARQLYPAATAETGEGLLVRAIVALATGHEKESLDLVDKALQKLPDCTRSACDLRTAHEAYRLRSRLLETRGDYGAAQQARAQALATAQRLGDVARQALVMGEQARLLHKREEREAARQTLRAAQSLPDLDAVSAGYLHTIGSAMARETGDRAAQRQGLERALQIAEQHDAPGLAALARTNLADLALLQGEPAQARQLLEAVLREPDLRRPASFERNLRHNLVVSLIMLREFEAARSQMAQMARPSGADPLPPREQVVEMQELSSAWAAAGQYQDALRLFHAERELATKVEGAEYERLLAEQRADLKAAQQRAQLELLRESESLQKQQLANQRVLGWIGWLAAVLVGLGLVLGLILWAGSRAAHQRLRRSQARLQGLADHDSLTQLRNRRAFQLAMSARAPDSSGNGGWLLLDVDHFKRINDQYGHAAGDQVLQTVAQRLAGQVRGTDLLVRWGGEEFLLFAPDITFTPLQSLAQRLLQSVAGTPLVLDDGRQLEVTASIGFAAFPLPPQRRDFHWERAVNWVDQALYHAKSSGRACAVGILGADLPDAEAMDRIESDFEGAVNAARLRRVILRLDGRPR